MQAEIDMMYLKEHYQPNPKIRYCPSIAAAAKTGRKKTIKRVKGALEKKSKKRRTKVKLSSMEALELGEEMLMDDDNSVKGGDESGKIGEV